MKLSNVNTSLVSPFQMAKQPALLNTDESLVFNYPVVIDKQLQKEWGGLIRDFFTLQILSQIKSSNILNITSSIASTMKVQEIDPNYRNPSDQLFNILQNNSQNPIATSPDLSHYYSAAASMAQRQVNLQNRSEIQFQLDSFREFIFNQIKNDPAYENLRPVATPIVVEGFINVPLIIGTKEIKIDSQAIFWILFLALADNREMTSENTITTIKGYISRIPKEHFYRILQNDSGINPRTLLQEFNVTDKKTKDINNLIETSIDKIFRQIQPIFNEKRWLEEVGIGRLTGDSLQISASQLDIRSFQTDVMVRFSNLFIGFMNRDLIRILQSLVYVLVPTNSDGIDFTLKYQTLINSLIELSKDNITENILNGIIASLHDSENSEDVINKIESFCGDINKISVKENFDEIHKLRMRLTTLSYSNLLNFMDDFSTNTTNLLSITKIIQNFIKSIATGGGSVSFVGDSDFSDVKDTVFKIIQEFFEGGEPSQVIFNQAGPIPHIFSTITGIGDITRTKNFFATCYLHLTEFVLFCYYYSFMGHMCEYFKELKIKIEIKRKNALSFPNYVLVIPSDYITSLFNAMAIQKVSDLIKSESGQISSKYQDFKITDNEITRMITVLNERLKIPHIVVVDSKSNLIYYKWNYLNRVFKLNISSVSNYIKTQKSAIQIGSPLR